jgi:hypothetical protein
MKPSDFLTELSNEKLAQYKTAAAADASKADKEKDFARGNKRFSGIVKATNKQFANDVKKESVGIPYPGTYEETNDMFKGSGQRRTGTLTTEQGVSEDKLNELDIFAPVTTYVRLANGTYVAASWRRNQNLSTASNSASFIDIKPVAPNVAKQLGLDQRLNDPEKKYTGAATIASGGPIQSSGPLADRTINVVDISDPKAATDLGVPDTLFGKIAQWAQQQGQKEQGVAEEQHSCPHCNGPMFSEMIMNEKKDACYYKVKSRYKVWPSAYASGALVKCRKKGASNWGNSSKNESSILEGINQTDESLHDWFNKEKWVRMDTKGNIKGPCAREPGEGKPKCLPQSKAHSLGKKGRASAAARKRREDPNPERSGKAINVNTKKTKG